MGGGSLRPCELVERQGHRNVLEHRIAVTGLTEVNVLWKGGVGGGGFRGKEKGGGDRLLLTCD